MTELKLNHIDTEEAIKYINFCCDKDEVHEFRILSTHPKYPGSSPVSVYFKANEEGISKALQEVDSIVDFKLKDGLGNANIYLCKNPAKEELYFRGTCKGTGTGTSKGDVTKIKTLLFDLDAQRPSGIMATFEEIDQCKKIAIELTEFLECNGFTDPMICFSGNGVGIYFKTFLENDNDTDALIIKLYDLLQKKFGKTVDVSVKDPCRVSRLAGTVNMKGIDEEPRPHRNSFITSYPENKVIINKETIELLVEKLSLEFHEEEKIKTINKSIHTKNNLGDGDWDSYKAEEFVENLLVNSGFNYNKTQKKGSVYFDLDECPVAGTLANGREISIWIESNGKICYKNMHNSGDGIGWKDVRNKLESNMPSKPDYSHPIDNKKIHQTLIKPDTKNTVEASAKDCIDYVFNKEKITTNGSAEKLWELIQDKDIRQLASNYKSRGKFAGVSDTSCLLKALCTWAQATCKKVISKNPIDQDGQYCNIYEADVDDSGSSKTSLLREGKKLAFQMQYNKQARLTNDLGTGMETLYTLACGGAWFLPKNLNGDAIGNWKDDIKAQNREHYINTKVTFACCDEIASAIDTHNRFGEKEAFVKVYDTDPTGETCLEKSMAQQKFFASYGHAFNIQGATQPQRWLNTVLKDTDLKANGYTGRFVMYTKKGIDDEIKYIPDAYDETLYERMAKRIDLWNNHHTSHMFDLFDPNTANYSEKIESHIEYTGNMSKFYVNAQKLAAPLKLVGLSDKELQIAFELILDILIRYMSLVVDKCLKSGSATKLVAKKVEIQAMIDNFVLSSRKELSVSQIAEEVVGHKIGASDLVSAMLENEITLPAGFTFYYWKVKHREEEIKGIKRIKTKGAK